MDEGGNEEVMLDMEGGTISSRSCHCRICHEEEEQSRTSMESPCACSGTIKFAHRECVQRWCGEKGSTICEICLQNFEPDYAVAPKDPLLDDNHDRGRLEASEWDHEITVHADDGSDDETEVGRQECWSPQASGKAAWCRSIATAFTILLLFEHLIFVIDAGAYRHPLKLIAVFALRAIGILVPFHLIVRAISAIQHVRSQYRQV